MSLGQHSMFDLMDGLEVPTHALARPHDIRPVEDEHEYAMILYPPLPPAPGLVDEVGEREQPVAEAHQHLPLDPEAALTRLHRELQDFQERERVQFGVGSRDVLAGPAQIHVLPGQDHMLQDQSMEDSEAESRWDSEDEGIEDSEDESMQQDPRPAGDPKPTISPDVPMQEVERAEQNERRSAAAQKPIPTTLEGLMQAEEILIAQVQYSYCEGLSTADLNAGAPTQDQSHTIQAELMAKDQSELPPLELPHTNELIKHVTIPSSSATASGISLTLATSPLPTSELPGASDRDIVICETSLEFPTSAAHAAHGGISQGSLLKNLHEAV